MNREVLPVQFPVQQPVGAQLFNDIHREGGIAGGANLDIFGADAQRDGAVCSPDCNAGFAVQFYTAIDAVRVEQVHRRCAHEAGHKVSVLLQRLHSGLHRQS